MKRFASLLLTLTMALSLTACAGDFEPQVVVTTPQSPAQSAAADPSESGVQSSAVADPAEGGSQSSASADPAQGGSQSASGTDLPVEGEYYYDLENVVLYLELYGALPENYITKNEARDLGWNGGAVDRYLDGAAIGGDRFGNREGLLPKQSGRTYTECDLNTLGAGGRGGQRLVFSNDGLYFYTGDHYESFTEYTVTQDWEVVQR